MANNSRAVIGQMNNQKRKMTSPGENIRILCSKNTKSANFCLMLRFRAENKNANLMQPCSWNLHIYVSN